MSSFDDDDDDDDVATVVGQAKHMLPAHLHAQIGEGAPKPLPAAGRPAVTSAPPAPPKPAPAPPFASAATAPSPAAPFAPTPAAPLAAAPAASVAAAPAASITASAPTASLTARAAPTVVLPRERTGTPVGFLVYVTTCIVLTAAGVGVLVLFKLQGRW